MPKILVLAKIIEGDLNPFDGAALEAALRQIVDTVWKMSEAIAEGLCAFSKAYHERMAAE